MRRTKNNFDVAIILGLLLSLWTPLTIVPSAANASRGTYTPSDNTGDPNRDSNSG